MNKTFFFSKKSKNKIFGCGAPLFFWLWRPSLFFWLWRPFLFFFFWVVSPFFFFGCGAPFFFFFGCGAPSFFLVVAPPPFFWLWRLPFFLVVAPLLFFGCGAPLFFFLVVAPPPFFWLWRPSLFFFWLWRLPIFFGCGASPFFLVVAPPLFFGCGALSYGLVVVGWLGRGTTALHCTHLVLTHMLKSEHLSLVLFLCFVPSFCYLDPFVCRHVVCADEASIECVGHCGFAQAANWLDVLVDLQLTAVYAESQDVRRERHDSIGKLTACWETLQSNVTLLPALSSVMVFATRS